MGDSESERKEEWPPAPAGQRREQPKDELSQSMLARLARKVRQTRELAKLLLAVNIGFNVRALAAGPPYMPIAGLIGLAAFGLASIYIGEWADRQADRAKAMSEGD